MNWRAYGLGQPKESVPLGPYIIAVSIVSPFIKFKNASKETVDASEELVEEIRRSLIQAGQRLSKYIKKEFRANDLEEKLRYIEQFGPILVDGLVRMTNSSDERKKKAQDGLRKILGRDADAASSALEAAEAKLSGGNALGISVDADVIDVEAVAAEAGVDLKHNLKAGKKGKGTKPAPKKAAKASAGKKPKIVLPKKSAEV